MVALVELTVLPRHLRHSSSGVIATRCALNTTNKPDTGINSLIASLQICTRLKYGYKVPFANHSQQSDQAIPAPARVGLGRVFFRWNKIRFVTDCKRVVMPTSNMRISIMLDSVIDGVKQFSNITLDRLRYA